MERFAKAVIALTKTIGQPRLIQVHYAAFSLLLRAPAQTAYFAARHLRAPRPRLWREPTPALTAASAARPVR